MLSRIPRAEEARIDPRKLREYALNPGHESGRFKAIFFAQMSYQAAEWKRLEHDISSATPYPERSSRSASPYGVKYTITAPLIGPSGEERWVTTVWIVRPGEEQADLVTITPAARRKEQSHE